MKLTRKKDEEKGWFKIEDFSLEKLEDKEIIFKAKDLADFFSRFDRWWLQIKDKDVCISYEGVSYEPHFYGKIRKIIKEVLKESE